MSRRSEGKRITIKHTRPNPLFQEWLENLLQEAREKNSKLTGMLEEALNSLVKYPLPLKTGAECAILKGFEKKLCKFLDMRLEVYHNNLQLETHSNGNQEVSSQVSNGSVTSSDIEICKQGMRRPASDTSPSGLSISQTKPESVLVVRDNCEDHSISKVPKLSKANSDSDASSQYEGPKNTDTNSKPPSPSSKMLKSRKKYKPAYRSGNYAILVALIEGSLENPVHRCLTKEEIIEKAQKYSDESFVRPKPESFYTAWSNITKLVSKGLVKKNRVGNNNTYFSLTSTGIALATEIIEEYKNRASVNDIIFNNGHRSLVDVAETDTVDENGEINDNHVLSNDAVAFEMSAGFFDIILLIDKNETGGVSKKNDPTVAQFKKYPDLKHEYRSLKVGDFTWIARHKINKEQELVLPYVAERKRMDDLGASIKDGRFHEQKFRLRKCGVSNVIYLVEDYGSNKNVGLPLQSLIQALANTRVQDGFKIHMTASLTNTVRFLAMLTKRLTIEYKDRNLKGSSQHPNGEKLMTFNYFNKSSAKNKAITVTEAFIKMLLQLKGMSVEKALAITKEYSTPRSLIHAYESCSHKDGPYLLANLKYSPLSRNVGPNISKSIFQMFVLPG